MSPNKNRTLSLLWIVTNAIYSPDIVLLWWILKTPSGGDGGVLCLPACSVPIHLHLLLYY